VTPIQPGGLVDHYRITDLVASGGMASVFRAVDTRNGREVALKIPHIQAESDPVFFERFQREIKIGARLNHPGFISVVDSGTEPRLYLAMEWAQGRLLRQILAEQGKLPADRAIAIALQICDALEYAHSQGVVHRDLKPENIMVDAQDRIKIVDFGIARLEGTRRLTFGKLSELMGSPDYISPEQVQGRRGESPSDLYALGIVLYEMLTGRVPFRGSNAFAIMNDRVLNPPIPPRQIEPGISPQIEEILYRALERDPRQRYPSAREFAWDLSHLDQVSAKERPEMAAWERRRSPIRRRVLAYTALGLIPVTVFSLLLFVARHG
jgi:eukaryotic-like serine/threonine-protein kinase